MREKMGKKGIVKRLLRVVLALVMVISAIPFSGTTVFALNFGDYVCSEHSTDHCRWDGTKFYSNFNMEIYFSGGSKSTTSLGTSDFGDGVPANTETWYYRGSDGKFYKCNTTTERKHVHTWAYSVENGNRLVATCTCNSESFKYDTCIYQSKTDDERKVSLSLTASSAYYSGREYSGATVKDLANKEYSASDNAWKVAKAGEVTVKYVGRDGTTYTESTTAPTKIGKYTVKLYPSSEESTRTHVATANFEITRNTDYDGKLIDFADTNWEYKFYTNGSYTSNVAGDTSGTVEKLKFYNISGGDVTYSGAPFPATWDSNRSNELTPSMIAGLISSVTNGVGVTCAYNASAHTLRITPIVHTHDWKYSATGNKLEAYCANADCPSGTDADHKVSITLTANSLNYSGSAYTGASITGLDAFKAATGLTTEPTITYWKVTKAGATAGGTAKTAEEVGQTDGYYYAKISVNGYSAVKAFTVGDVSAKSQPKTGVMDTLPMWFGVMAVSAAAYVLTSKKRFF